MPLALALQEAVERRLVFDVSAGEPPVCLPEGDQLRAAFLPAGFRLLKSAWRKGRLVVDHEPGAEQLGVVGDPGPDMVVDLPVRHPAQHGDPPRIQALGPHVEPLFTRPVLRGPRLQVGGIHG